MDPARRMLDANANRAREALRMLEDLARFAMNNASLAEQCKHARHELARAIPNDLLAHRDTPNDVGTHITTPQEGQRSDLHAVGVAAGKRLSEALRVLEEVGKTVDGVNASAIEQLRYQGYALEQRIVPALKRHPAPQWRVCLLLTRSLCLLPWQEVLKRCLDAGLDALQIREKNDHDRAWLDHASEVQALLADYPCDLILNDRIDLALALNADALHLGQHDLPLRQARRLADVAGRRDLWIGLSCNTLQEVSAALDDGADSVGLGPMFATDTAKEKTDLAGPQFVTRVRQTFPELAHLAIGGITPHNASTVTEAGAKGLAVSRCVCAAEQPDSVVKQLLDTVSE